MKWSWKLGRFAGIDVFIHATFLLLLAWIALSEWLQQRSLAATISSVVFIVALFACVVLHEYGHALTARRYGIKTRDITLLPIGGVARLERIPEDPQQELWVALAGPAVNIVLAGALYVWLSLVNGLAPLSGFTALQGPLLNRLMAANIILALFNLIPAFPMDGGRVARALLATRMEYTQATHVAATLGQGIAFLFGMLGLFINPFLMFVALFVWIGASQEASATQMRSSLSGIPINQAMVTDFHVLSPQDTLTHAVNLVLSTSQQDFPVVENGEVVGVLTNKDLLAALADKGEAHAVGEVMRRDIRVADVSDMLETVFERLQECRCRTVPVAQGGRLVGLMTTENLGEFLMVQAARRKSRMVA